ncbi:MAG: PKD domain-containing protein [Bacteroidia bacterium]|nr:PKD domain-containing protein [Bacteroidia bacterium]
MKKLPLLAGMIILVFSSSALYAQDWAGMMNDRNANMHDVQKAFNNWYSAHKPDADNVQDKKASKNGENEEDGNYELYKRWEWLMEPRTYPTGKRPDMAAIEKEYQNFLAGQNRDEHRSNLHRVQSPGAWTYTGNVNIPANGDAGRLNRIRINPSNSNILYACAPSGGLWISTNGGFNWTTKTDRLADLATSDVAIDYADTSIMYLATGDGDGIGGGESTPSTIGVLKSTDGGNTWKPTSLNYTLQNSGPGGMTVNELVINPVHHNTVFAATSFGLFFTSNAGISWNMVLSGNIKDMAFEPSKCSVMYATTSNGHFYRSVDSGYSFTQVVLPSSSGAGRMALAVTPANSSYVYVLADNSADYSFLGLWQSTDEGQTFTLKSTSPNLLGEMPSGFGSGGQGWYDLALAASPSNASEILVGGVNIWRSTNGGGNWSLNASQDGFGAPYVHADIHHIIYQNATTCYAACDGGLFRTTNNGGSWGDLGNKLEIAEQYCIGLSASNASLWITGWQDNGTNLASGGSWTEAFGGDGMDCFIDYSNNNNLYCETYQGGFQMSNNGGSSFNSIAINTAEIAAWVTPWIQDPKNANTIFAGIENVWKSTDQGNTWNPVSNWGQSGNSILAIAVAPSTDSYIYASNYSSIYRTSNGGGAWTNVSSGLPLGMAQITDIAVDPGNPQRVWVTFSGYSSGNKVYQSVNAGSTWTNISTGLPNLPANCIVYDKTGTGDAMYAGTDMGVYYRDTVNTGGTWVSYNTGLPNVMVTDLQIYAPSHLLNAATYGRGTWQVGTYVPAASKPVVQFQGFPATICAGSSVQFTDLSANQPVSWNWTLTGGTPPSSGAQNPSIKYMTAGLYPVKLVAANGIGSDSLTMNSYIKVNPLPAVPAIVQNGYQLSVVPNTYQFYQWYFKNNLCPDQVDTQWWIGATGMYKIVVTDSTGCSNSATLDVTNLTGVQSLSSTGQLLAYPNPASGNLEIVFNGGQAGDYVLALSNILGQTLYSENLRYTGTTLSQNINLQGYDKGVYFLSVSGINSRIVKKITVF